MPNSNHHTSSASDGASSRLRVVLDDMASVDDLPEMLFLADGTTPGTPNPDGQSR